MHAGRISSAHYNVFIVKYSLEVAWILISSTSRVYDLIKYWQAIILIDLLKPTDYVMHQQFNTQQLYVLPTLYLCVLFLSENKQRIVPLKS